MLNFYTRIHRVQTHKQPPMRLTHLNERDNIRAFEVPTILPRLPSIKFTRKVNIQWVLLTVMTSKMHFAIFRSY